jgi:hypothetical protein
MLNMISEAFALYQGVCEHPDHVPLERFARTLVPDTRSSAAIGENHKYLQDAREDYEWFRKYLSD